MQVIAVGKGNSRAPEDMAGALPQLPKRSPKRFHPFRLLRGL